MLVYAICLNCVCMLGNRQDVDVGARVYNYNLMLFLYMEATPASLYRTWHHTLLSFFHALCTSNCASTKAYASVLKFIKAMAHVADVQKKP